MQVRLIGQTFKPEGCPISLSVKPKTFTGANATDIVGQIKAYFADDVIPHIPFTRKDDDARAIIRAMSNAELECMLIEYQNAHNGADPDLALPLTDQAALEQFAKAGLLVVVQ